MQIELLSRGQMFDLQIELVSADRIFDLEILIRSEGRIIDLQIVIQSADRIFDLKILILLEIVILSADQIQFFGCFSFKMKKHLKIKFSWLDTFCLILKIKKVTPLGFGRISIRRLNLPRITQVFAG